LFKSKKKKKKKKRSQKECKLDWLVSVDRGLPSARKNPRPLEGTKGGHGKEVNNKNLIKN
jgi:hypothetical protein